MIVILDYGMGNLRSVERAFRHIGADVRIQTDLSSADRLVIPGVGAFAAAMERIGPLADDIRAFAETGRPILGICLGQQLLFESSEEFGHTSGLGLIRGAVRYFPENMNLKVPHMGWNTVECARTHPLMNGLTANSQVYFVHSLYTDCTNPADVVGWTEYGIRFPSVVARENVWGCQFHPEKSGEVGLKMLEAFVR